jgi:hypothetical protein
VLYIDVLKEGAFRELVRGMNFIDIPKEGRSFLRILS